MNIQIKNLLTTLSFASLLLVGCSKSDSSNQTGNDRLIRLGAGITTQEQPKNRAAVNEGTTFTAAVAGWESSKGSADFGSVKTWLSTAAITASENAAAVTLSPERYYNQTAAVKTYIKAWYPAGTLADDGKVSFGGTPDGTVDVLTTKAAVGSAIDATGKNLSFTHPLTQLKFKVAGDATFASVSLKSITIKGAELPAGIDLTTDAVIYGSATPLLVPGITSQSITTTATTVGTAVMVKPFTGNTFKADVVTSAANYNNVTITINNDASFVPGKAYTITLTFAGTTVGVSSNVTPWDESGTGNSTIQ